MELRTWGRPFVLEKEEKLFAAIEKGFVLTQEAVIFFGKNHSKAIRTCQDDLHSIGSEVSSKMISDKHLLSQINEQFKTLTRIAWTLNGSRNESQTSLKSICNQMLVTQKKVQEELVWHSPIKAHSNPFKSTFSQQVLQIAEAGRHMRGREAPFTTS